MQSSPKAGQMFYEPPSRLQQADKLSHLVRYSDFVLLVLGDEGSGKSRLLQEITPVDLRDTTLHVCSVTPQAAMDVPELMGLLLSQLPGHSRYGTDQAGQLKALYEQVSAMRALGQRLLLLIDDADLLSDAALELLFNFMAAGGSDSKGAQAVLLGKPDFEQRLRQARLLDQGEGRLHRTLLEPYAEDEAREFLRLRYPTLQNQPKKKIEELLQNAAGLPGALDSAAIELLRSGELTGKGSARAFPFPLPHLAGIVFVLIAITGVATWQFMPESDVNLVNSVDRVEIELQVPADEAQPRSVDEGKEDQARQVLAQRLKEQERKIEAALKRVQAESSANAAKIAEQTVSSDSSAVAQPVEAAVVREASVTQAPALLTADKPLELALPDLRDNAVGQPLPAAEKPLKDRLSPVVSKPAVAPVLSESRSKPATATGVKTAAAAPAKARPEITVVEKSQPQKAAEKPRVTVKPETVSVQPEPPVKVATPVVKRVKPVAPRQAGNPIMTWSEREYTLQMLGARDRATVNKFLRQQTAPDRFYSFSTIYKGKPWHVVVYGRYSSRKAAVAATAKLPPKLRKLRPWARSVQGVQADIRKK
ncbi:AAA family ATPase [Marinobacterium jannaschii]|uniref:AAA family ATPase n=1 Tax=Marinobacterium jannaschii TaxID=64970 RepID=UPI000488FC66|nr:AAA family ATPase [Marinobacterium jannaschii]